MDNKILTFKMWEDAAANSVGAGALGSINRPLLLGTPEQLGNKLLNMYFYARLPGEKS